MKTLYESLLSTTYADKTMSNAKDFDLQKEKIIEIYKTAVPKKYIKTAHVALEGNGKLITTKSIILEANALTNQQRKDILSSFANQIKGEFSKQYQYVPYFKDWHHEDYDEYLWNCENTKTHMVNFALRIIYMHHNGTKVFIRFDLDGSLCYDVFEKLLNYYK